MLHAIGPVFSWKVESALTCHIERCWSQSFKVGSGWTLTMKGVLLRSTCRDVCPRNITNIRVSLSYTWHGLDTIIYHIIYVYHTPALAMDIAVSTVPTKFYYKIKLALQILMVNTTWRSHIHLGKSQVPSLDCKTRSFRTETKHIYSLFTLQWNLIWDKCHPSLH